ncbi:MAG: serine--tRNA ligase [Candidatus Electryonea clarkiae]|nr:serine--tRNA ligase [Candidatus Electryonea clarkiae]MDP8287727.1 serine--tRNA ligase [Candidatus Electryonea clarkiae]
MHDIRRIRKDPNEIKESIARKGFDADIEEAVVIDDQWRNRIAQSERLKSELNKASRDIGAVKKAGNDAAEEMKAAKNIRVQIAEIDEEANIFKDKRNSLLLTIPAEPDEKAPEGLTEDQNVIYREATQFSKFDYKIIDHVTLAEELGILDMARGSKITGTAFPVYIGDGATLERALINFMLDEHVHNEDYKEVFIPFLVNRDSALGTGQLPKLEDDMYYVGNDELYLIPTSEVPITNLHRNEILNYKDLPIKYTAYSACFRREAGAYGAETRGLLRIHQFNKVELVQIVEPESSEQTQLDILSSATRLLDMLELPYRVVELCCGELSFAAARCFDIEVWSPATENWLECSSISNFRDFQARRMNLRYREKVGNKPNYPHTLNGSALATSRLMVSILENYQTPERRVRIPRVLKPYMNNLDQIRGNHP